jgi:hypothetical protein
MLNNAALAMKGLALSLKNKNIAATVVKIR